MSAPRSYVRREEADAEARREAPAVASRRHYLRNGLPPIHREGAENAFTVDFVEALETVLDPIVAMIDGLPAHFSVDFAPQHILELMAAWLGIGLDESDTDKQRREVAREAMNLGRRRGTKKGLEQALQLEFRDLAFRVEDRGGVVWEDGAPSVEPPYPGFVVYCEAPLSEARWREVAALIDHLRPVNTMYDLQPRPLGERQEDA